MPRLFLYFLTIGCALALPAAGVVERHVERSFDLPGDAALNVDVFDGAVRITDDPDAKTISIVVTQTAEVETESAMDSLLAAFEFHMSERNGTVMLVAKYRKVVGWSWNTWSPVNLLYEIRVPRRCDVTVATHKGMIVIGSLEGRVVLSNESGSIFTGEIQGPVTARSHSGEIAITSATGRIHASTRSGNITIGRAGGLADVSSEGGYIELQQAGAGVMIRGNGSDAKVGFKSPILHASDIAISGGELALALETDSACTLDVRASVFGTVDVRGELPVKVTAGGEGRSLLKAIVNGGGPSIVAKASGGNVVVRGVTPFPSVAVGKPLGMRQP
jgi:hypothetical protein